VSLPFRPLTLSWFDIRLYVGMRAQDNNVFSLVYEKTANGYQCRTVFNPAQVPISWPQPVKQLNIDKAHGLTTFRHRFLIGQGAVGKAAVTKQASIMPMGLSAEHEEFKRFMHIKEIVSQAIKNAIYYTKHLTAFTLASVFKPGLMISYQQWQVYFIHSQSSSPPDKNKPDMLANQHIYAVLEGLSPLGQFLYIRFSLEQDSSHEKYAKINIKSCSLSSDVRDEQLKKAVLELLQPEKQITPTELTVYHIGSLFLKDIDDLLTTLLLEAGRQQEGKAEANRIIYRIELTLEDKPSVTAYTNLTWLQSILSKYLTLKITPQAIEAFSAPPKESLFTTSASFFNASTKTNTEEEIISINVQNWLSQNKTLFKL
ncbi:MAG: hypothetical protein ACK4PR_03060, partial [Gammaproteobacteria bacterium]